jgi:hypothetical protein
MVPLLNVLVGIPLVLPAQSALAPSKQAFD